jgi:hypothetical protein
MEEDATAEGMDEQLNVLARMEGDCVGGQRDGHGVGQRKGKDRSEMRDGGDCGGGERGGHGVEERKVAGGERRGHEHDVGERKIRERAPGMMEGADEEEDHGRVCPVVIRGEWGGVAASGGEGRGGAVMTGAGAWRTLLWTPSLSLLTIKGTV